MLFWHHPPLIDWFLIYYITMNNECTLHNTNQYGHKEMLPASHLIPHHERTNEHATPSTHIRANYNNIMRRNADLDQLCGQSMAECRIQPRRQQRSNHIWTNTWPTHKVTPQKARQEGQPVIGMPESGAVAAIDSIIAMWDRVRWQWRCRSSFLSPFSPQPPKIHLSWGPFTSKDGWELHNSNIWAKNCPPPPLLRLPLLAEWWYGIMLHPYGHPPHIKHAKHLYMYEVDLVWVMKWIGGCNHILQHVPSEKPTLNSTPAQPF